MAELSAQQQLQQQLGALAPQLHAGGRDIADLRRLSGGASQETWSFDLRLDDGSALPLILRRAPAGSAQRAEGNATLATQAVLLGLVAAAGVPAPAVPWVLQPAEAMGEGFFMQRIAGETLGRRIVTEPALANARGRLARQCGQALARIHRIAPATLPPLRRAPPAEELAHYEAQYRSHGLRQPVFELALRWLKTHAPAQTADLRLVHGDFRNGNLIVGEDGLRAVLDWELAHLGDPMEDLGWLCVTSWRYGRLELPVGGFGTREELFAGYAEAGGQVDAERVHYWEVLGSLKWGVICQSMAHSYLSGAERNAERAAIGRRASEAEIDLLELLVPRPRQAA
ncbi:MAG: phosphotransferase family protein [Rubrivivax sp.]|nr:phosphotransferase family protein [Rubrivivax sp.]